MFLCVVFSCLAILRIPQAMSLLKKAPKNDEIEKISAELRPEVEAAEAVEFPIIPSC